MTTTAWCAGLPAAVVAIPRGLICGLVGCAALDLVPAPGAVIAGVICGLGAVTDVAAGSVPGLFVGKKVEECWDNEKAAREW